MFKITAIEDTVLKQSTAQASTLPAEDKIDFNKGTTYNVKAWLIAGDHFKVTLDTNLEGKNTWFVYIPHVDFPADDGVLLKVPFYLQTDNRFEPGRTCNTSACAMVAKFLGAKITGDDDYYKYVIRYGDTTDHGVQTKALLDVGIKSTWHTALDFKDLNVSLDAGFPIVIGILHRGTLENPRGGHMIVVVGRTPNGDYICNDPYGSLLDRDGAYTGNPSNGKGVVYPRYVLKARWLADGPCTGWGRLFYDNPLPS